MWIFEIVSNPIRDNAYLRAFSSHPGTLPLTPLFIIVSGGGGYYSTTISTPYYRLTFLTEVEAEPKTVFT
ncbi:MAG: hypothetical protein KZQ97_22245, partial [Candidatus Thiodiazotropha sp. (ex Dulcina madagascariensis)]|nr:hypothetical protein [Candidatus Thiodiazotropha sp. (ex Dulcina madagascariensis)]